MAIYHLSMKPISRSAGRSATAAAAYRAGCKIGDERTGEIHDYTRKRGVLHTEVILPGGGTAYRSDFWNDIEAHHKRGDAVLAREIEVSLPTDLTQDQRQALAVSYARELADRYGVAADVALHAPRILKDKDFEATPDRYFEKDPETGEKTNGNWHAHILLSACHVEPDGTLGKKAVELDPIHCQRAKIENAADQERQRWADLVNDALLEAQHKTAQVDHRTLDAQGIDRLPQRHLGPSATGYETRTREKSWRRLDQEQEAADRLARAKELGELERQQSRQVDHSILDLSGDLAAAKAERDQEAERQQAVAKAERDRMGERAATTLMRHLDGIEGGQTFTLNRPDGTQKTLPIRDYLDEALKRGFTAIDPQAEPVAWVNPETGKRILIHDKDMAQVLRAAHAVNPDIRQAIQAADRRRAAKARPAQAIQRQTGPEIE